MFEHLQQNGDLTHFYFCYRWFLLDFKRGMYSNTNSFGQVVVVQTCSDLLQKFFSVYIVALFKSDVIV